MQGLLVYGSRYEALQDIVESIESQLHIHIFATNNDDKVKKETAKGGLHLAIVDTRSIAEEVSLIQKLRDNGFEQAILVLSEEQISHEYGLEKSRSKIHYLEKPYSDKEFVGIVKKLLKSSRIPQQKFKRFETHQEVVLEKFNNSDSVDTRMFNLSVGGAYCEFSGESPLIVGDLVKVMVKLGEVNKQHKMNAKVVWTTRTGRYSGQQGAGLKFIRSEDVYLHLINKV